MKLPTGNGTVRQFSTIAELKGAKVSEPKHRCWSEGCTEEGTVLVYEKSANSPERWVCPTHLKRAQKLEELDRGIRGVVRPPTHGSERKVAPLSVSSPNVIEIKLNRLIDDMRLLRSQMIAFDRRLDGIESYLKSSEPSEQQPEYKSRLWFAAAASATARAVLFAVGAATGAALLYLGT